MINFDVVYRNLKIIGYNITNNINYINKLILAEQHIINSSNKDFRKIDKLSYLSKNLYNAALYAIKQEFLSSGKWLRYNDLEKLFRLSNQTDYRALPGNTSQQILMLLDKNLKSYFALLKKYKKDKKSISGCPRFPKYKDKLKGRNQLIFTTNQVRLDLSVGVVKLPKRVNLSPIKTKVDNINQLRIIPRSNCYIIEIVYNKSESKIEINDNWLSIDPGLNNLLTCYDSANMSSLIINGKPLKSINQYYNKKRAELQEKLIKKHNKYVSNRINKLTTKRNNKIKNYLHKSSRIIVDYCIDKNITNIVIGHNKDQKQDINLGRRNNQNFVDIPHMKLYRMIEYKAKLAGINLQLKEESYTSKCSALDLEPIQKHTTYAGKREKRGQFISNSGIIINADANGAMNILRKVTGDKVLINSIQTLTSRGQVVWPIKVNFNQII